METTKINGYEVRIFNSYNGTQLFINDREGNQIYAHKVSGNPMERAMQVIARQS